jgi:hypothetical protein
LIDERSFSLDTTVEKRRKEKRMRYRRKKRRKREYEKAECRRFDR